VSSDLRHWTLLADALVGGDEPAWDDRATWTGSVVRDPAGGWRMFYTGVSRAEHGLVQRIGTATSDDLVTWDRDPVSPVSAADPAWYERYGGGDWFDEAWRDPWVFADPDGDGWHMLITARSRDGAADDRGVIGHARSADLRRWVVEPPLSKPGSGFGQLEVPQVEVIDGRPVLLFSCLAGQMSAARRVGSTGGVWAVASDSVTGPFEVAAATPLTGHELYSGKLVRDRSGGWVLLAFDNVGRDGQFLGQLSDPVPVGWRADGRLALRP